MQPFDSCRLFALNLYSFVNDPFTDKASFDYNRLYQIAYEQQRLADDLIDLELEHISRILAKVHSDDLPEDVKRVEIDLWEKVFDVAQNGRRTGCGFTGFADALAALNVKYDEGHDTINRIMYHKMKGELDCTIDLAILRGAFDGWDKDVEFEYSSSGFTNGLNDFYEFLWTQYPNETERMMRYGRRNISWSTCAPTGSVSLLTQTSSGLEPLFQPYYMRRKKINPNDKTSRVDFVDQNFDQWQEYPVLHPKFEEWYKSVDGWRTVEGDQVPLEKCSPSDIAEAFRNSPWYGSTANDIDWIKRVEIQAIIQRYTSHSISSTINLPETVTKEEVAEIYMKSYDIGLKGVTIYRDHCRTGVLVSDSKPKVSFEYHDAPKRPKSLPVVIHSTTVKGRKFNVIVGILDNKPYEVFAVNHFTNEEHLTLTKYAKGRYDLEKNGETYSENITAHMGHEEENLTRMISTALRHGASITFVTEQLNKSKGDITSFAKAIARVLSLYADSSRLVKGLTCSDCGSSNLILEEGCQKCKDCGSSKCG